MTDSAPVNLPNKKNAKRRAVNGILLLDKPLGLTSNRALQRTKRVFQARKAGHTGSLDPLATGLLPICFGEATKVCAYLLDADKDYRAEFTLGARTSTGDSEGDVIETADPSAISLSDVQCVAQRFRGDIEQVPPMHSALKKDGKPLYRLAREGITVERKPRAVHISELNISSLTENRLVVEVSCSKGTYIRTLAEDIGLALGCFAHVSQLRRVRVGDFDINDAKTLDLIEQESGELSTIDRYLMPPDLALAHLPRIEMSETTSHFLTQGQTVTTPHESGVGPARLYRVDVSPKFLGIGEVLSDGRVKPSRLFNA